MKFVFNNPDTVKESKEPDCSVNGSNSTAVSADTVLEIEYSDLLADYGDKSFHDTSSLKPRSFASMQLRARNAIRSLIRNQNAKLLLLCGSSSVNVIDIAFELVTEITGKEPVTAYAPTKYECFGDDKNDGVFTSSNIVIMPCNHLIDHPKWLGMVNACLAQNNSLKLILCGDATECAGLSLLWPVLDNAISSDIVQEFSAKGGLNLIGSLVKSYESRYSLKPFSVEAVDLLCLWASRQAGDRRYLCILEQKLINFCIEASFYAKDKTVKPLFGDAATVTALEYDEEWNHPLQFSFGVDGSGYQAVWTKYGGTRNPVTPEALEEKEVSPGVIRRGIDMVVNGMDVFSFAIKVPPRSLQEFVDHFQIDLQKIDYLFLHQANRFIDDRIRKKLKLPEEKVPFCLQDYGNTNSASIPLTMVACKANELQNGLHDCLGCGFGVGLAWGCIRYTVENLKAAVLFNYEYN